jgi:hypothetical protein
MRPEAEALGYLFVAGVKESGRAIARYPTLPGDKAAGRGWGTRQGQEQKKKQIPFGNDRKNGKGKGNSNGNGKSNGKSNDNGNSNDKGKRQCRDLSAAARRARLRSR